MNIKPRQLWKRKASGKTHTVVLTEPQEIVTICLPSEEERDYGESFLGEPEQFMTEFQFVGNAAK